MKTKFVVIMLLLSLFTSCRTAYDVFRNPNEEIGFYYPPQSSRLSVGETVIANVVLISICTALVITTTPLVPYYYWVDWKEEQDVIPDIPINESLETK